MSDIRDAGIKVQEYLSQIKCSACIVDLSSISYIGSSMVALIVRIWKLVKTQGGHVVVVAPGQNIRDVLKITGLTKVWTIVDTFEAAVHSLGCSMEAKVEKRERRLLTFVGPLALIGAAVAVAAVVIPGKIRISAPQEWTIHVLGGLSLLASSVCVFRDTGWRKVFSSVGLVLSISLAAFWFWHKEFRSPAGTEYPLPSAAAKPSVLTTPAEIPEAESLNAEDQANVPMPDSESAPDPSAEESGSPDSASLPLSQPRSSESSAPSATARPSTSPSASDTPDEERRSDSQKIPGDAETVSPPVPASPP